MILASICRMPPHGAVDQTSRRWCGGLVVALVLILGVSEGVPRTELCERSQANCVHRVGCSAALQNYFFNCDELIHGVTQECVPRCRKALIALLTTEDNQGTRLMTCDCGNHSMCLDQRLRLEVCSAEVFRALEHLNNDDVDISCSLAQQICEADTSCNAALGFYQDRCTKLFLGEKCTEGCNNSLSILYRQQKARKLRTCVCDGSNTEKLVCERIRHNTHHLCLSHRVRHPNRHDHTRAPKTDSQDNPTFSLKNATHSSASWNEELTVRTGSGSRSFSRSWMWTVLCLALTFIITLMPQR